LVGSFLGTPVMLWLVVTWTINCFTPAAFPPLHERPLLIYSLGAVLLGAQMISIGLLAELITDYMSRDEDAYSIAERVGTHDEGKGMPAFPTPLDHSAPTKDQ